MTTPSILSDVAAARDARVDRSGAVRSQKATAVVPASTPQDAIIGLIRFEAGFSLQHLALACADLDSSTNVTLDVGYVYDDGVGDSLAAFVAASTIPQAGGSVVWPVAAGLLVGTGFVATKGGYITAQVNAATTTEGNIVANALFSYDA